MLVLTFRFHAHPETLFIVNARLYGLAASHTLCVFQIAIKCLHLVSAGFFQTLKIEVLLGQKVISLGFIVLVAFHPSDLEHLFEGQNAHFVLLNVLVKLTEFLVD